MREVWIYSPCLLSGQAHRRNKALLFPAPPTKNNQCIQLAEYFNKEQVKTVQAKPRNKR